MSQPPVEAAETPSLGMSNVMKFVLPTLVGAMMFLVPIRSEGSITIGIGVLAETLEGLLGAAVVPIGVVTLCLSVVLTGIARWMNPAWTRAEGWGPIFHVGGLWFGLRIVGALFGVLTLMQVGPEVLTGPATGSVILNDLIPVLLTFFLFALLMLPCLVAFGLMEFVATLVRKPFRKIFGLPGRSAVDATASWMGAAPLGVLITYQQYERGFYTERE